MKLKINAITSIVFLLINIPWFPDPGCLPKEINKVPGETLYITFN